jgi:hypothetical protein
MGMCAMVFILSDIPCRSLCILRRWDSYSVSWGSGGGGVCVL